MTTDPNACAPPSDGAAPAPARLADAAGAGRRRPRSLRDAHGRSVVLLVAVLACGGCAGLPADAGRVASTAIVDAGDTTIGRVAEASVASFAQRPGPPSAAPSAAGTPDVSGFQLLSAGDEAFGTLFTLISQAQRSLDLQYYIVADDPYSRTLLRAAREAADRGVRVRLLIDDFYTTGNDDRIAWYAGHPNVEVRLFNPFRYGRTWFATRVMTSLIELARVNRRMHNKLFVADGALAVTGGRNVGAEYYQHSGRTNFLDLDVLAAGPIVADLEATFDQYWNSPFAYPIESLAAKSPRRVDTIDARALSDPRDPVAAATAEARDVGRDFAAKLASGRLAMTAAPADLFADLPTKIGRSRPRIGADGKLTGATIATDILSIVDATEHELIVVSPYFVPGERGMAAFRKLVARGVRITVITNSLAATDAAIVHIGYARYRRPLLEMGVEIYELRPDPADGRTRPGVVGSSKASLHAKVQVIDRKKIFIGSFNVDQRSSFENTEMGLEIESEALAQQVVDLLRDRDASRYRVTIAADGGLQWTTTTDGVEAVFRDEPGVSRTLEWSLKLLAPFAPEQML